MSKVVEAVKQYSEAPAEEAEILAEGLRARLAVDGVWKALERRIQDGADRRDTHPEEYRDLAEPQAA